jgi:hypothetical protein
MTQQPIMRKKLTDLVKAGAAPDANPPSAAKEDKEAKSYRVASTRAGTRQIAGYFPDDVVRALKLIAVEHDRDQQDILAEALNMVFEKYGKAARATVLGVRRSRAGDQSAA